MRGPYRIVIAEDHTILREGLRALLSSKPDFEIVGEAEDGRDAIRRVGEERPDLILMDLSMPKMNGLEAIKEINKQNPELPYDHINSHCFTYGSSHTKDDCTNDPRFCSRQNDMPNGLPFGCT